MTNKNDGAGWHKLRGANLRHHFCSHSTLFAVIVGCAMLAQIFPITWSGKIKHNTGMIYHHQELLIKLINYKLEYDHIMLSYLYLVKQININKVINILTISSSPETLWGLTKMMAQGGANCVWRSVPSFLQSPDPFCSPQRVIMMAQFPSHVDQKNKYCGLKMHHPMQFYIQIINCNASICLNLVLIFVSSQTDQNW